MNLSKKLLHIYLFLSVFVSIKELYAMNEMCSLCSSAHDEEDLENPRCKNPRFIGNETKKIT